MDVVGAQLVEIQESIEVFGRASSEVRALRRIPQEPLAGLHEVAVVPPYANNRITGRHVKLGVELGANNARSSSERLDEPEADLPSSWCIEADRSPAEFVHVLEPRGAHHDAVGCPSGAVKNLEKLSAHVGTRREAGEDRRIVSHAFADCSPAVCVPIEGKLRSDVTAWDDVRLCVAAALKLKLETEVCA